jgi:hypothetical protein
MVAAKAIAVAQQFPEAIGRFGIPAGRRQSPPPHRQVAALRP